MRLTTPAFVLPLVALLACGGTGSTEPSNGTPTVSSVEITPSTAILFSLSDTLRLTARAADASGNTISGKTLSWSSSDESVATIGGSGLVTAVANGSATITATVEGINGTAVIEVADPVRMLSVEDPVGDHTGSIDVVRMVINFDNVTGDYEITLTAESANPFVGDFRISVLLFNPEANSFFRHGIINDFDLTAPTTTITLEGRSGALTSWEVGHEVFTNSLEGTPNPVGSSLYRSSVLNFPMGFLTNEDVIAFPQLSLPAIVQLP